MKYRDPRGVVPLLLCLGLVVLWFLVAWAWLA